MDEQLEKLSRILMNAVKFDINKQYDEAYSSYRSGLELYMGYLKECPPDKKPVHRQKIAEMLSRAEIVKQKVEESKINIQETKNAPEESNGHEQPKNQIVTTFHEEIILEENSTGYGYERVFSRMLNDSVHTVKIEEPYLRSHQQFYNFIRFCELLVKRCKNLRKIIVYSVDATGNKEFHEFASKVEEDLQERNIKLEFCFCSNLHDRQISFSNGWVVKIGRGLHYFKPIRSRYNIGSFDLDLALCHNGKIDIYLRQGLIIE